MRPQRYPIAGNLALSFPLMSNGHIFLGKKKIMSEQLLIFYPLTLNYLFQNYIYI